MTGILQTHDSGYVVAGYTNSNDGDITYNHGGNDYWLIKIDKAGALQWSKTYGGSKDDRIYSFQKTLDGGFIIAGTTNSNDGDVTGKHDTLDGWIVKLNDTGAIEWQKTLGGSYVDYSVGIKQMTDSGYVVAGSSHSYDGDVSGNHGSSDCWVVYLNKPVVGIGEVSGVYNTIKVYPIPSRKTLQFEFPEPESGAITVFDITGKLVTTLQIHSTTSATIHLEEYPAGLYTYRVITNDKTRAGNFVVE